MKGKLVYEIAVTKMRTLHQQEDVEQVYNKLRQVQQEDRALT